jgi:hypothetical protein
VRIGICGGAFGFRGGISTRGIGVGVGPLSVGTSWHHRRRRRSSGGSGSDGGFLVFVVAAVALYLLVAGPYLFGTYVAVGLGAGNPSTARSVVGWIFEILWIAGLLAGGLVWSRRNAEQEREQALQQAEWDRQAAAEAVEEARLHAELVASSVFYATQQGNTTVYRHGNLHDQPPLGRNRREMPPQALTAGPNKLPPPRKGLVSAGQTAHGFIGHGCNSCGGHDLYVKMIDRDTESTSPGPFAVVEAG